MSEDGGQPEGYLVHLTLLSMVIEGIHGVPESCLLGSTGFRMFGSLFSVRTEGLLTAPAQEGAG